MKINLFGMFFCFCLFVSCAEEADIPVYINLNEPTTNISLEQGSDFQIIEEFYLFHRTSLLGGFSYGNNVPVLADGNEDILIFPGIRVNSVKDQPDIYSMMEADTLRRLFTPGDLIEFTPQYRYRDQVVFRFIEDFESGNGFALDTDGNENTKLVPASGRGYNGSIGGVLAVTEEDQINEIAWSQPLTNFPLTGDIIVEITYKSTIQLQVGILATTPRIGSERINKLRLFPSAEWNKVYIDLAPEIRSSNGEQIQLLFGTFYEISNSAGEVILDDIKLLHLQ